MSTRTVRRRISDGTFPEYWIGRHGTIRIRIRLDELEDDARVENLVAIAFYEKAGWTVTDRLVHTVEHGISYDERVLIKHHA